MQINEVIKSELNALRQRIIAKHIAEGQVASGKTKNSLKVELYNNGGILWGRDAFSVLETGRKGGKVPKGFRDIILAWMQAKGISATPIPYVRTPSAKWQPKYTPTERGNMSMAGAIAYTIAKSGTKQYRSGSTKDIYSTYVKQTITNINLGVMSRIGVTIRQINDNLYEGVK